MVQESEIIPDILIERGSFITHCGFSGEEDPVSTFRTPEVSMEAQFRNIFENILKVEPSQYRVIVVKNTGTKPEVLKEEAHILFNIFQVKACAFVNAQVGVYLSWVTKDVNGLIIDIGYENTLIVPLLEVIPQQDYVATIPMAGRALEQCIMKDMIKNGISEVLIEENKDQLFPYLMRDYYYFDSESEYDYEKEAIEKRKHDLPKIFTLKDKGGKILEVPLPSPILSPDIILKRLDSNNFSFNEEFKKKIIRILDNLGKDKLKSLVEFDADPYTSWWVARIIINGGASKVLGLRSLLIREFLKTKEFKRYTGCKRELSCPKVDLEFKEVAFTICNVPPKYNHSSWLGASIMSSFNAFKSRCFISKETYQKDSEIKFLLDNKDLWKELIEIKY